MKDRIIKNLKELQQKHRIIFWYDDNSEFRQAFDELVIDETEKIELRNNEYFVKYKILKECPKKKFLLYQDGPKPADTENWLLDVLLGHAELRSDQASLWLNELGLGQNFLGPLKKHKAFFQSEKRFADLKKILTETETENSFNYKLLAVCCGSDPKIEDILKALLIEDLGENKTKMKLLVRFELDQVLWRFVKSFYAYDEPKPSLEGFMLSLFGGLLEPDGFKASGLKQDAFVFFKQLKDSRQFFDSFSEWSRRCSEILNADRVLLEWDLKELIELDYFEEIERIIISKMIDFLFNETCSEQDFEGWLEQRRKSFYYSKYEDKYEILAYACKFIFEFKSMVLHMDSLDQAIDNYCNSWFKIDQNYRKFIYFSHKSGLESAFSKLKNKIDELYSNEYLLKQGDQFQTFVDRQTKWRGFKKYRQSEFYKYFVRSFIEKKNRICVIISDAFRYEVAEELLRILRAQNRIQAKIEPLIGMLPSYTQLGMAALLPHKELEILTDNGASVLVDGINSMGLKNREKILKNGAGPKSAAIHSDNFLALVRDDAREFIQEAEVLYFYHDRIDHTGDKLKSEGHVFEAAEKTIEDLLKLVKSLFNLNVSNILITADHGFIYQDQTLDETDFLNLDLVAEDIYSKARRYLIGKGLKDDAALVKFKSEDLGLKAGLELQIPKSINRLRLKGSGSRFVHGGASLQELVIPVLTVNQKNKSDLSFVEIGIYDENKSSFITTNQHTVILSQKQAVTEKVQGRILRVGIYAKESGELISDQHEEHFNRSSTNKKDLEFRIRFILTKKADELNGQKVVLKLEEKHNKTNHYKLYDSKEYTIRKSFVSDFDF